MAQQKHHEELAVRISGEIYTKLLPELPLISDSIKGDKAVAEFKPKCIFKTDPDTGELGVTIKFPKVSIQLETKPIDDVEIKLHHIGRQLALFQGAKLEEEDES